MPTTWRELPFGTIFLGTRFAHISQRSSRRTSSALRAPQRSRANVCRGEICSGNRSKHGQTHALIFAPRIRREPSSSRRRARGEAREICPSTRCLLSFVSLDSLSTRAFSDQVQATVIAVVKFRQPASSTSFDATTACSNSCQTVICRVVRHRSACSSLFALRPYAWWRVRIS